MNFCPASALVINQVKEERDLKCMIQAHIQRYICKQQCKQGKMCMIRIRHLSSCSVAPVLPCWWYLSMFDHLSLDGHHPKGQVGQYTSDLIQMCSQSTL